MIVLDLKPLPYSEIQNLLKNTYSILTRYRKNALVPKQISKILLAMDEFIYFASLMEEKELSEGYYCSRQIRVIFASLKDGFFKGKYPIEFPNLQILNDFKNSYVINLNENFLSVNPEQAIVKVDANADTKAGAKLANQRFLKFLKSPKAKQNQQNSRPKTHTHRAHSLITRRWSPQVLLPQPEK